MIMNIDTVIVGLQNPGEKYDGTRHNIGGEIVKKFAHMHGFSGWRSDSRMQADVCQRDGVLLVLPTTFMNKSGESVAVIMKEHPQAKLIVVHDDVDLPVGELKVSENKGAGGHNGVQNIIDRLKTKDFMRIRIGIMPKTFFGTPKKPSNVPNFVVGPFTRREKGKLESIIEESIAKLEEEI